MVYWSYMTYIGEKEEKLITSKKVLSYFKNGKEKELYRNFVESAIKTKVDLVQGGSINGSSS